MNVRGGLIIGRPWSPLRRPRHPSCHAVRRSCCGLACRRRSRRVGRVTRRRRVVVDGPAGDPKWGRGQGRRLSARPWWTCGRWCSCRARRPPRPPATGAAAGVGAGLDLLTWLERHIFSREREFRAPIAEVLVPRIYHAMAAVGTTTILAYGAIWADSLDVAFQAASPTVSGRPWAR